MQKSERLPLLDGWRGLAIITLLMGHFGHYKFLNLGAGGPYNFGRVGVELFFVLSGTLMGRLLFIRKDPLPLFYKRRISRIFPAALFYIAGATLITLLRHTHVEPVSIFAAATFWINYYYPLSVEHTGVPLDHFWSLSVEEHSYVILSLITLLQQRVRFPALLTLLFLILVCFVCAIVEGAHVGWNYYQYYWHTECRASSIFLGTFFGLLMEHHRTDSRLARWLNPATVTTAFLCGLLLQMRVFPDIIKYTLGTCLLAFSVNNIDLLARPIRRVFASKVFVMMGVWSFSFYLWQQLIAGFGIKAFPLLFPIGLFSFYCIEQPVRVYLNKVFGANRKTE